MVRVLFYISVVVVVVAALSFVSSNRDFDPRTRPFSDEDLKPQPMVKKSRKQVRRAPR